VHRKKAVSRKGIRTRAMLSEEVNEALNDVVVEAEDFKIKEKGVEVKDEPGTPSFSPLTDIEDLELDELVDRQ
jgi:hypothetical protein